MVHSKTTKTIIVLHKRKVSDSYGLEIDKLQTNFEYFEKYNGRQPNIQIRPLRSAPNKLVPAPTQGVLQSEE